MSDLLARGVYDHQVSFRDINPNGIHNFTIHAELNAINDVRASARSTIKKNRYFGCPRPSAVKHQIDNTLIWLIPLLRSYRPAATALLVSSPCNSRQRLACHPNCPA